jgi:hypothetical protein
MPTIPVARVLARWSFAAVIGEQRTTSQTLGKRKNYFSKERQLSIFR